MASWAVGALVLALVGVIGWELLDPWWLSVKASRKRKRQRMASKQR
jgi:uncharacterized protein (DUF2062 family)